VARTGDRKQLGDALHPLERDRLKPAQMSSVIAVTGAGRDDERRVHELAIVRCGDETAMRGDALDLGLTPIRQARCRANPGWESITIRNPSGPAPDHPSRPPSVTTSPRPSPAPASVTTPARTTAATPSPSPRLRARRSGRFPPWEGGKVPGPAPKLPRQLPRQRLITANPHQTPIVASVDGRGQVRGLKTEAARTPASADRGRCSAGPTPERRTVAHGPVMAERITEATLAVRSPRVLVIFDL
jgi:hypothetical protein